MEAAVGAGCRRGSVQSQRRYAEEHGEVERGGDHEEVAEGARFVGAQRSERGERVDGGSAVARGGDVEGLVGLLAGRLRDWKTPLPHGVTPAKTPGGT